jgi:vancomycin resistance protein YoaR
VEKGEDATVNYPSLDFVFKNEGEFPVFVVAWYENQQVTVEQSGATAHLLTTLTVEKLLITKPQA